MTNNPTIDGVSRVLLTADREMRVYIAGPMSGIDNYNFPAFNAMADKMRAAGWHVENPADHGLVTGAEWGDYLRYDIGCLASCEAIMLLPGWTASRGARLEVSIAKELGIKFIYADGAEHAPAVERQEPVTDSREREEFERAVTALYGHADLRKRTDGCYANEQIQSAWWGWKERGGVPVCIYWDAPTGNCIDKKEATIAQLQVRIAELESGRGEPVAWRVQCVHPRAGKQSALFDKKYLVENWATHWRDACGLESSFEPLYTTPPAPVATLWEICVRDEPGNPESLCEYVYVSSEAERDSLIRQGGASVYAEYACLDATAALNKVWK